MTNTELITQALEYAEWADANIYEVPITLPDVLREMAEHIGQLLRFKQYWDELYGEGLEIANWNMNGTTVPFDDFYESALEEKEK